MPCTTGNKDLYCGRAAGLKLNSVFSQNMTACFEYTSEKDVYMPLCLEVEIVYSSWLTRKTLPANLLWILGHFPVCEVFIIIFIMTNKLDYCA